MAILYDGSMIKKKKKKNDRIIIFSSGTEIDKYVYNFKILRLAIFIPHADLYYVQNNIEHGDSVQAVEVRYINAIL